MKSFTDGFLPATFLTALDKFFRIQAMFRLDIFKSEMTLALDKYLTLKVFLSKCSHCQAK